MQHLSRLNVEICLINFYLNIADKVMYIINSTVNKHSSQHPTRKRKVLSLDCPVPLASYQNHFIKVIFFILINSSFSLKWLKHRVKSPESHGTADIQSGGSIEIVLKLNVIFMTYALYREGLYSLGRTL